MQRFNRIKRSFSSRIKAEENDDYKANTEGKDYRTGRNDGAEIDHNRDHLRRTKANQNTNYASQQTESYRFDEKL
jgi:hypothetical protein